MNQEQLVEELAQEIARGQIVIVAGAGVSIMACGGQTVDHHAVASWDGLLLHGVDYCLHIEHVFDSDDAELIRLLIRRGKPDFLIVAAELISDALRKKSRGTYSGWLKRALGHLRPSSPGVLHSLAQMGGVLATLNYDSLFEQATGRAHITWQNRASVEAVLRAEARNKVVHIHGYYDDPDSVVLGLSSYTRVKNDPHTQNVLRLFALDRTLLFVGCRGTFVDPNFERLLEWAAEALSESDHRHFLLCRATDVETMRSELRSVSWLYPIAFGNEFSDLIPFLQKLAPAPQVDRKYISVWNIPPRNEFFSGRDLYLDNLHSTLTRISSSGIQALAIRGIPGAGKTQTAISFAHRYRSEYIAAIFITADSRKALVSGFAMALGAPEEQDLEKAAVNAMRWFQENSAWLLILDNVEDWDVVREWIPATGNGHVLMTTRLPRTGTIELPVMTPEEGAALLLKRAKIENAGEKDKTAAREISRVVGGLPLALDQAGAFIEEARIEPAKYLALYEKKGDEIRRRRALGHDSVTVTFTLVFEKLSDRAKDIVRICAFLAPDAIPIEILTSVLGVSIDDDAVAEAVKLSLISHGSQEMIEIHRQVQAVVRDGMSQKLRHSSAERIVTALKTVFPSADYENWARCERLLPHVEVAAKWIEELNISSSSASELLNRGAWYIFSRAQFNESVRLFQRALAISEEKQGPKNLRIAPSLNGLAVLYRLLKKYAIAEEFARRALAIRENKLGRDHPDTAESLINLALILAERKHFPEAERLLLRARKIREKKCRRKPHLIAYVLNDLAEIYAAERRYPEALRLHRRALAIRRKMFLGNHPDTASSLANLGGVYLRQKRFHRAEVLYELAEKMFKASAPSYPMSSFSTVYDSSRMESVRRSIQSKQAAATYDSIAEIPPD